MAIRDVVTRGFGSWQTTANFIPTRGYTPSLVVDGPVRARALQTRVGMALHIQTRAGMALDLQTRTGQPAIQEN